MKISTIIVMILALLTPPIVVPPAMTAIQNRGATITADVVEAAPAPIVATLTAKAVAHHSLTGGIMGVVAQERPSAAAVERCKRQVRHTRIPKRQSITDDMDAKYVAAINASNAQATVVQKCLDSLR